MSSITFNGASLVPGFRSESVMEEPDTRFFSSDVASVTASYSVLPWSPSRKEGPGP